jgi:hypothetical protein
MCLISSLLAAAETNTKTLDDAVQTQVDSQQVNKQSQQKVNMLSNETQDIAQVYRNTLRKSDSLETYNQQLSKLVSQQKESLNSIQRQLDNAEETKRSIVPLMLKMISTLEQFVALDIPFLLDERQQRVAALQEMMDRPDVTLPDKYRRIMEAYQIEMEYGRTIEAYNDTVQVNGIDYTVDLLRVGRLTMAFQTLDAEVSGAWNRETKKWEILGSEYHRSIQKGLQIANKQAPPDLVKLPIQVTE